MTHLQLVSNVIVLVGLLVPLAHSQPNGRMLRSTLPPRYDSRLEGFEAITPPRIRRILDSTISAQFPELGPAVSLASDARSSREWEPVRHRLSKLNSNDLLHLRRTWTSSSDHAATTTVTTSSDSVSLGWLKYYASNQFPSQDYARSVTTDDKGNVYVTGQTDSTLSFIDIVTLKYSPGGTLRWKRRYTSDVSNEDVPYSIGVDLEGNVYVGGTSLTRWPNYDFIIIKYDSNGVEQWATRYDGPDNDVDLLTSMAVDASGNVYVAGASFNLNSSYDFVTIKYNTNGVQDWVRTFDGPGGLDDGANDLAIDTSGNVYVTGFSNSGSSGDVLTIKYNSAGVLQWSAAYDGPNANRDEAYAIDLDDMGNVFVAGYSFGVLYPDYLTIKYDNSGIQKWASTYDGQLYSADYATALAVNSTGDVYVGGKCTASSTSTYDYGTVKYDSNGVKQWDRTDNPGPYAAITALALDLTQNVVITGDFKNFLTIKYSPTGVKLWEVQYDGPKHGDEHAFAIAIDLLGNVVIAGSSVGLNSDYDFAVLKYTSAGVQQWVQRYNGTGGSRDFMQSMKIDQVGNVYIAASIESRPDSGRTFSMGLIKYSPDGDTLWTRRYAGAIVAYFSGMVIDTAGNIVMSGTRYCTGTSDACSVITVKYTPDGSLAWSRVFGTAAGKYEARAVGADKAGNVYVGGLARYGGITDYLMLKYSSSGILLWSSEHNSEPNVVYFVGPLVTDDAGNVTITGYGSIGGMTTRWNSSGTKQWIAVCPGNPEAIALDDSGNTYVTGPNVLAKFDLAGGLEWAQPSGGFSVAVDPEFNVYIANEDLLKYKPDGTLEWSESTPDGNVIITVQTDGCGNIFTGAAEPGVSAAKYDQAGTLVWNLSLDPFYLGSYRPLLEVDVDDQLYIGGFAFVGNASFYASYLAKLTPVPALGVSQDSIVFGGVHLSCSSQDTVTLTSTACMSSMAFSVVSSDSDIVAIPLDISATPNSIHTYIVRFSPSSSGMHSALISFTHNTSNSTETIQVQGSGLPGLPDYSSPSVLYQNTAVGCSESETISIKNLRCEPLIVDAPVSDSYDFVVDAAIGVVAPGDSADFTIRFAPLAVGSRTGQIIITHNQDPLSDTIFVEGMGTGSGTEVAVTDSFGIGWQLISSPVDAPCPSIFSPSYTFSHGYIRRDTLESGRGYWNKLTRSCHSFAGDPVTALSINVEQGWNIIGSISEPVSVSTIQTVPPGIIQTPLYGFSAFGDYAMADTVFPGHAYWLKTSQSGTVTLAQSSLPLAAASLLPLSNSSMSTMLDAASKIIIEDSAGRWRTLYVASEPSPELDANFFELPPAPPLGSFDVRFESGRIIEVASATRRVDLPILLTGVSYPVHLKTELHGSMTDASIEIGSSTYALSGHDELVLAEPGSSVTLKFGQVAKIPSEFALAQNYPNPFNPSTTIEYALPSESKVLLTIYNMLGQRVGILVDAVESPGFKKVRFESGALTSGVYFYHIQAGSFVESKKLLLMR